MPSTNSRSRALVRLAAAAGLLGLVLALWPEPSSDRSGPPAPQHDGDGDRAGHGALAPPPGASRPVRARPALAPAGTDALHTALGEDAVRLTSAVHIEDIDRDRPWVCAGEPIGLAARVGGAGEPGAVYRWVWMTAGERAELHPGPALRWSAPASPGRYTVHFQVCKDLGGRRVGVLAERAVEVEVRACVDSERQQSEPLAIEVTQRGHNAFAFVAAYRGDQAVEEYVWDLGDETTVTSGETGIEHAYAVEEVGAHDVQSFTVRLRARLAHGEHLEARTMVVVRGQPPAHDPPRVDLQISRWQPRADGTGWHSEVTVRNPDELDITWERVDRVTKYMDGRADIDTHEWRDVIAVDDSLERGGFRGRVLVDAAEVPPEVKQIIDSLYGHDAAGEEVVVSWTPFKREAPPPDREAPPPPRK